MTHLATHLAAIVCNPKDAACVSTKASVPLVVDPGLTLFGALSLSLGRCSEKPLM
jgi:hypothetical protein